MLGKIYIIKSNETTSFYIGSTIKKDLATRLSEHKSDYKRYIGGRYHYVSSFDIMKYADAYIELIDVVEIENKNELRRIEGNHIKMRFDDILCVNRILPTRTKHQYYIDKKEGRR